MPLYVYRCTRCGEEKEVRHNMSELDDPSEKTMMETTCNEETCPILHEEDVEIGKPWERVPQLFGMDGDKLINNPSKRAKFKASRDNRNRKHFEDEVLPWVGSGERKHFLKKRGFKS